MLAKWDIEMADKCELPKLINGICELCRDYAYCYRPITLFDEYKYYEKDEKMAHF